MNSGFTLIGSRELICNFLNPGKNALFISEIRDPRLCFWEFGITTTPTPSYIIKKKAKLQMTSTVRYRSADLLPVTFSGQYVMHIKSNEDSNHTLIILNKIQRS